MANFQQYSMHAYGSSIQAAASMQLRNDDGPSSAMAMGASALRQRQNTTSTAATSASGSTEEPPHPAPGQQLASSTTGRFRILLKPSSVGAHGATATSQPQPASSLAPPNQPSSVGPAPPAAETSRAGGPTGASPPPLPASGRYGGAIVRLSDLRSQQPSASAAPHPSAPAVATRYMMQDNGAALFVTTAAAPVAVTRGGGGPTSSSQRRSGTRERNTTGRRTSGRQRRSSSSRRGRGEIAATLETRPDGSLYAHSWSTVRGKRMLKYHGNTYRGTQAHRMWEQIKQHGGRSTSASASPSPPVVRPSSTARRRVAAPATDVVPPAAAARKRPRESTTSARPAAPAGRRKTVSALVLSQADAPRRRKRRHDSSSPEHDNEDEDDNDDGFFVADEDVDSISATSSSRQSSPSDGGSSASSSSSSSTTNDVSEWESFSLSAEALTSTTLTTSAPTTRGTQHVSSCREVYVISESDAEEEETLLERAARLHKMQQARATATAASAARGGRAAANVKQEPTTGAAAPPVAVGAAAHPISVVPPVARCAFTILGRRPVLPSIADEVPHRGPHNPHEFGNGTLRSEQATNAGDRRNGGFSARYDEPVSLPDGLAGGDLFTTSELVDGYYFT